MFSHVGAKQLARAMPGCSWPAATVFMTRCSDNGCPPKQTLSRQAFSNVLFVLLSDVTGLGPKDDATTTAALYGGPCDPCDGTSKVLLTHPKQRRFYFISIVLSRPSATCLCPMKGDSTSERLTHQQLRHWRSGAHPHFWKPISAQPLWIPSSAPVRSGSVCAVAATRWPGATVETMQRQNMRSIVGVSRLLPLALHVRKRPRNQINHPASSCHESLVVSFGARLVPTAVGPKKNTTTTCPSSALTSFLTMSGGRLHPCL